MTSKKYKIAKSYLNLPPKLATKFMTLRTYTFWGGDQGVQGVIHQLAHDAEGLPQVFCAADQLNCTLLMCAVEQNRPEIVRLLIDAGAETEVVSTKNGGTPLNRAAQLGDMESVCALVENGADMDFSHDLTGNNILMISMASRRADVALYLIDQGAKCDQQTVNMNGSTAADFACVFDMPEVFLRLIEKGVLDASKKTPLQLAAKHGARGVTRACLEDQALRLPALDDRFESVLAECAKDEIRELILSARSEALVNASLENAASGAPAKRSAKPCFPSL